MNRYLTRNMNIIILSTYLYVVSAAQLSPPPRSVNVALETSFLFDPKEANDNISFIHNIKVFLDKLYKILAPQVEIQQFRTIDKNERRSSFSDFIHQIGQHILNFTTPQVKEAVKVLKIEVKKIADNTKSALHNVLPDPGIKNYIIDTVNKWAEDKVPVLKEKLKMIMKDNDPLLTTFTRRLNDYFTEDDIKKLNKYLRKLNRHIEKHKDLTKIVKGALEFGITEKLKKLNSTSTISLMNDMKLLSEFINQNKVEKSPIIMKRNNIDVVLSKDENETPGPVNDSVERDEIYNELKKTIGEKLKKANERMNDNDKKGINNKEILVDNVELYVQSLKNPDT